MKKQKTYFILCSFILYGILAMGQNYGNIKTDTHYFPIAVWLQSPSNAAAYKDNGINMFVGLWHNLDQNQLETLRTSNMKVICTQNSFGLSHVNDTLIYAWMHGDEPDNAQWNNGYLKGCDIGSFDIYPVNSSDKEIKDNLWYVANGMIQAINAQVTSFGVHLYKITK